MTGAFSVITLSIIAHALMRNLSLKNLFVVSAILATLLALGTSIVYFYQAGAFMGLVPVSRYNGYLGLAYFTLEIRYLVLGIIFAIFSLTILVSMLAELRRIGNNLK